MPTDSPPWDPLRWSNSHHPKHQHQHHQHHQHHRQLQQHQHPHHHPHQHQQLQQHQSHEHQHQHHQQAQAILDYPLGPEAPQLSAPTAINPASQSAILRPYGPDAKPTADPGLPQLTEPYTDASNCHSRPHARHSPAPGGNYGPQQLRPSSQQTPAAPWRSLNLDRPAGPTPTTDTPLTLQIPDTRDLPRISPPYPSESQIHSRSSQHPDQKPPHGFNQQVSSSTARSLPSFASFQEHASRSDETDEGPEIAPMSSRLSCYVCTKLEPMVRDVAVAVAELDENVQSMCSKSITRNLDFPKDNPVRVVQWVLDRLKYAKSDLQESYRRGQSSYLYQQLPPSTSPLHSLKRAADPWDGDSFTANKRPRPGVSPVQSSMMAATPIGRDGRRQSNEFASRGPFHPTGLSPPQSESIPGSAYPKHGSPSMSAVPMRALPSPSSVAQPSSAAPLTAQSLGSPGTPYQPTASIHTASTNSVTSAHIADLQHQVTLKSLALQTLQSEYASLLQKLQRERVKSQTIEKKTSVANQEVNELTGKNEELTEQVKTLEAQVEETEKRREHEAAAAASEKAQWGRMLDMSGRIQAKQSEERQKLVEDKDELLRRVAAYQEESMFRMEQYKKKLIARHGQSQKASDEIERRISQDSGAESLGDASSASETTELQREVSRLRARTEILRSALDEVSRHAKGLDDKARDVLQHHSKIEDVVQRALKEEQITAVNQAQETKPEYNPRMPSSRSTPARTKPAWSPQDSALTSTGKYSVPVKSSGIEDPPETTVGASPRASSNSTTVANYTRAVSPSPADLGFEVQPTRSSPEELIQALGPLPTSLPSFQFMAASYLPEGYGNKRGFTPGVASSPQQCDGSAWKKPAVSAETANDQARFRPAVAPYHHVPSPYNTMPAHSKGSPHSYHSSPGPIREDDSDSADSAMSEQLQRAKHADGPSQFRPDPHHHHEVFSADMPPPPKPLPNWPVAYGS